MTTRFELLFVAIGALLWDAGTTKITEAFPQPGQLYGQEQVAASVSVDGDVSQQDRVTLRVSTKYGSTALPLRRVERPVLHEDVATFTVTGHEHGTPSLRWHSVSDEAKFKAKQFFYDLDSGAVVSIIPQHSDGTVQVKGFIDHQTRISPVADSRDKRASGLRPKERSSGTIGHTVWKQSDNIEWRILSHLGMMGQQLAKRRRAKDDDDGDDEHDKSVHRDDYLEVPAMFLDRSLWVGHRRLNSHQPKSLTANKRQVNLHDYRGGAKRDIITHNDDDDDDNDDGDRRKRGRSKNRRRGRRLREKRESAVDMRHNPFHTTFSSRLSAFASLPPNSLLPITPIDRGSSTSSLPFSGTYVVEVMVMVDVKTYSEFNYDPVQLEDYILHFWQVVNLRLRAIIDPRLQLRIRSYGKILFAGFQQFIEGSRVHVNSESLVSLSGVIEGFRGWMQSYETNTMYSGHDVAVLMTGENLCKLSPNGSCSDSPKGIGYMGGACITSRRFSGYTYDVAVVEADRSYRGVLTATHELGHLLNASHDGEGSAMDCTSSSGYIMSYTWTDAVKFNRFSSCSKRSISQFLTNTWYSECLRDTSDRAYAYRPRLPGQVMTLQDQCMHYNAGVPCSSRSLESQCHNLCCENILKVSVSTEPAADGTVCAQGKSCFAGQCVADETIPGLPTS